MNNLRKELAAVSGVTIASLVAAGCVPMVQEVQSPTQLPNLDLGTPSPTPEELGRIQDYCEKLGYDKVNYAATWKVAGEKPFAYSYCSVQENGVEQFVVVGYQNKDESVTMNQMLIADEATVDGRLYRVAGIFDPKDGAYKAIITVDEDGNQAAFDIGDQSNMVVVPPQGDNGVGDQVKGFLGDFFIESAIAAELEVTETPIAVVQTATVPDTEVPIETPTATVEVEKIDDLFPSEWLMESDSLKVKITKELMEIMGINIVEVDRGILESSFKLLLSRWAWKLAQVEVNNMELDLFRNVDQKNSKAMIDAFENNKSLGDKGFKYGFNFGRGSQGENVEGQVGSIEINGLKSVDYKTWDNLISELNKNSVNYRNITSPGAKNTLVYFKENGQLVIYTQDLDSSRSKNTYAVYLIFFISLPQVNGEYTIGEEAKRNYGSVSGSEVIFEQFGCGSDKNYCLDGSSYSLIVVK